MSSALEKSLAILELMAERPEGVSVSAIAQALDMPVSGVHRALKELARLGYARQVREQGDYALTVKLAAMGLSFLGRSGVTDIAQPILDRLAAESGELIRLSVLDGDDLVWVAVAQGATGGLRYDPGREQGVAVHLASTAGGLALLAALTDEEALARVARQGVRREGADLGSRAPATIRDVLTAIAETRARGWSVSIDTYIEGMAAMAAPVRREGRALGCLSIAGPAVRLTMARMEQLAPALIAAAEELAAAADASHFLHRTG